MTSLRLAVVFLTRIPIGTGRGQAGLSRAVPWFPVVGAGVGAASAGVYALLEPHLTRPLAAGLAIAVGVVITGAFHLDGLADTADAVAGGSTPARRLEILDDSRLGTYGTAAVVLQLLLQVLAVAALGPADALRALVAAHAVARAAAVGLMGTGRPARSSGLGVDYLRDLRRRDVTIAVVLGVAAAALLGAWGLAAVVAAVVVVGLMTVLSRRAFGGIGGDVLGATEQVTETAVLIIASASI